MDFVVIDDPRQLDALQAFAPGIIGRPVAAIAVCMDRSGNEGVGLELLIAFGYPAGPVRVPRRRRTMAQIARRNWFGCPFEGAAAWDGDGPT